MANYERKARRVIAGLWLRPDYDFNLLRPTDASVIYASIGSDNGLSAGRHQAIV